MAEGGGAYSSDNLLIYSIQRTYILNVVSKSGKEIVTCDQRIDIPTIEPLTEIKAVVYQAKPGTVIPCIELSGNLLDKFNFVFETNEGVTVLPVKIRPDSHEPLCNPYRHPRYVLVLPIGTTGVKSCKVISKVTDKEVQHNLTFGIMPPPYNYDNALFGYLSYRAASNKEHINILEEELTNLKARVSALENKAGG